MVPRPSLASGAVLDQVEPAQGHRAPGTEGESGQFCSPDGQAFRALMAVETPKAQQEQNHVILLMNFCK
jgi:hypothetical protein